eukprot:jgi/Mesvir1/7640/Mv02069-RA.1
MDPITMMIGGAIKLGMYLDKSSSVVDKVNATVKFFMQYDTDGDRSMSAKELQKMLVAMKDKNDANAMNTRCLIYFVMGCHVAWEKDPATTKKKLERSKFWNTTWDSDPALQSWR